MKARKVLGNGIPKRDSASLERKEHTESWECSALTPSSSSCHSPGLGPRAPLHSCSLVLSPLQSFPFGMIFLDFLPAGRAVVQKFRISGVAHSGRVPCLASLRLPGLSQVVPRPSHTVLELSLALPLPDDAPRVP